MSTMNVKPSIEEKKDNWIFIYGSSFVAVFMFAWTFYNFASFVGSTDNWNSIKPQMWKILVPTIVGAIALTTAAIFYFIQNPQKTMYFVRVMACLSICISYASLAVAAISR